MTENNYDIIAIKKNETFMEIHSEDENIHRELYDFFCFESPNAQYSRNRKWDGQIRLYNTKSQQLYCGLIGILYQYCKLNGLTIDIDPTLIEKNDVDPDELEKFIIKEFDPRTDKGDKLTPYDFQMNAITHAIAYNRSTMLAATAAGKSLIIYAISRMYELMEEFQEKSILILVPTKALVEQMYSDFNDYSNNGGDWKVEEHCQKISGDYDKIIKKNIVISTYQSMMKQDPSYFKLFNGIIVDEAHLAKADSFKHILTSSTHIKYRHGLTGTLDESKVNKLIITGLLGNVVRIIKTHELQETGRATKIDVKMMMLMHDDDSRLELSENLSLLDRFYKNGKLKPKEIISREEFLCEIDHIINHNKRNNFVINLAKSLKGNTLVLGDRIEKHLEPLYIACKEQHDNTFIIVGTGPYAIKADKRIELVKHIDSLDDAIIFASYGTMSTGINAKNIHNLILASSSKSIVRVLQSIGRILRLHKSKKVSTVYDITDVLSWKGWRNRMLNHAEKRMTFYTKEKWQADMMRIDL